MEIVTAYAPGAFRGAAAGRLPSPVFSLAANALTLPVPAFEFLPPKPTLVEQLVTKYSSGRLRTTGAVAAGVAVLVLALVLFQQIQLCSSVPSGRAFRPRSRNSNRSRIKSSNISPGTRAITAVWRFCANCPLAFPEDGV